MRKVKCQDQQICGDKCPFANKTIHVSEVVCPAGKIIKVAVGNHGNILELHDGKVR